MRKTVSSSRFVVDFLLAASVVLAGTVVSAPPAFAQNYSQYSDRSSGQASPQAEERAEDQVSLSAETIIGILREEPGLLLQVKKALVRVAYEQGRILEPADLTDDALFQLLWSDVNVRALATDEIEERYYVRAKPTREELEREALWAARHGLVKASQPTPKTAPGGTPNPDHPEEEASNAPVKGDLEAVYWSTHGGLEDYTLPTPSQQAGSQPGQPYPAQTSSPDNAAPGYGNPSYGNPAYANPGYSNPDYSNPGYFNPGYSNPGYATPNYPAQNNPARQLDRTDLQSPFQNFGNQGMDSGNMPRISPDQLPGLLAGSSQGSVALANFSGSGNRDFQGMASGQDLTGGASPFSGGFSSQAQSPSTMGPEVPSQGYPQQASLEYPRFHIPSPADLDEDRPLIRPRPNPYADVPSLYDLYAQVSQRPAMLQRFGLSVFRNGTGNLNNLPMDLPAGPDYVLGPGDGLNIELWGGVSERLQRVVDREGQVALPEVGTVQVSGRTLSDVQHMVQSVLRTQFRDVSADVSLARIRAIRVYVVGDVERPGAYDISSLSTALNALYAAGGPTSRGSLRHLRQYRGQQLVQEIDAYDLLLHGVHSAMAHLQSGDTIQVPDIGAEVTIEGMVRRPAIYELNGENNLAAALQLAGGVLPSGTLRHIDVERVVAHEKRTMLELNLPVDNDQQAVTKALEDFKVQDGDQVRISPILPYADKTVYLDGHVFHPGKYPYRAGMKLTDLIHSYSDLLPEPSLKHAEIIRLEAPDYRPEVLAFNLQDAMAGKTADPVLKPFDTVRVFGRFDFEDPPVVTITGAVRDPGEHITNGVMRLRDAVYLAGGLTPDAQVGDAQIYRHTENGKFDILSVNLQEALAGDPADNILLQPKDRVLIHHSANRLDPATVQVEGEVAHPGRYPLGADMTAAELVRVAGGFKRGADTSVADLTTYAKAVGGGSTGEHESVEIAKAMSGVPDTDPVLHDGDVLSIRQLAGWNDRGAIVAVTGEVLHPGTFGIQEGERLSSVLERAGGFREDAYPYGAILERVQVREIEEKDRADLIDRLQQQGASLRQLPDSDPEEKLAKEASLQQWQATLQRLQSTPPAGRLVIHISSNMKRWAGSPWDVELRAGDQIVIPKRPGFVMVNGQVYNPTAVTYRPGKNAEWYLKQAGGATNDAAKKSIFLIRGDGSVVGGTGGLFSGGVLSAELRPGDMLVVPEKAYTANSKWKTTLQASQLTYAVGIAIQVARTF